MILLGSKVPPLPPVRGPQLIAETILGAVVEGHELDANDVREVVDFRHEHGGSRLNEAVLILARGLAKSMQAVEVEKASNKALREFVPDIHARNAKAIYDLSVQISALIRQKAARSKTQWGYVLSPQAMSRIIQAALSGAEYESTPPMASQMTDHIMEQIRLTREKVRSAGGVFSIEDIRPILEGSLT